MKKKLLALLVALTLICSMFATVSVSAATSYNVDLAAAGGTTGFTAHGYSASTVGLMFGYGKIVDLGNINLADYKSIVVTYANDSSFVASQSGMAMTACFAIAKSNISIGWPDGENNGSHADILAKADCSNAGIAGAWSANERTVTIDVSSVTYSGKVYLSHYNSKGHESLVTKIRLVAADTGSTPPATTYDAQINLDAMNISCWTANKTIIFDNDYTATAYRGKYHNTIVCTYSEAEGAYVVTSKSVIGDPAGDLNSSTVADNQIVIDSTGTAPVAANQAGWDAVQVGSLIYLNGVDLEANTVEAGAFAGIVNKDGVDIPDAPKLPISALQTSIDFTFVDGAQQQNAGAGGTSTYVFADAFDIDSSIAFAGWAATPNGVAKYQYSIDGQNFYDITDATISAREDLTAAGIPHSGGHATAGFTVKVPVSAFNDGVNTLTIRLIDTQDGFVDILKATVNATNPGGAQIPEVDDDNTDDNTGSDNTGNDNAGSDNTGDENTGNVGTDDSVAIAFVMMFAIVAMAAVVIKRRKENV